MLWMPSKKAYSDASHVLDIQLGKTATRSISQLRPCPSGLAIGWCSILQILLNYLCLTSDTDFCLLRSGLSSAHALESKSVSKHLDWTFNPLAFVIWFICFCFRRLRNLNWIFPEERELQKPSVHAWPIIFLVVVEKIRRRPTRINISKHHTEHARGTRYSSVLYQSKTHKSQAVW